MTAVYGGTTSLNDNDDGGASSNNSSTNGGGGNLLSTPTSISFSSACVSDGLAELSPAVVDNSSGRINTTYTARGCKDNEKPTRSTFVRASWLYSLDQALM